MFFHLEGHLTNYIALGRSDSSRQGLQESHCVEHPAKSGGCGIFEISENGNCLVFASISQVVKLKRDLNRLNLMML